MRYLHQIVTKGDRDVTNTETIYCNSDKPKFSMKCYLQIKKDVQYEIYDRETKKITIVV
jgi:hypothetical protein